MTFFVTLRMQSDALSRRIMNEGYFDPPDVFQYGSCR